MQTLTTPATPEARALGCACHDLIPGLEYRLVWSDCGETAKVWIPLQSDSGPFRVLAWDRVMVAQCRIARLKTRRCFLHTGEFPTANDA